MVNAKNFKSLDKDALRATTSVHVFYTSIFTLKTYFFYFTHSLL